jgi:serine/threonine protein kinase
MNSAPNPKQSTPVDEFAEELMPGTTLLHGQYTIESFLNSGGFGLTYLARDSLDRIVVIKECFPGQLCMRRGKTVRARSLGQQDEFRAIVRLFVQEARRLAKLDHPNIVGVHQVFEDNETAYMALDFVDGQDMHEIIENDPGRLTPALIVTLLKKLLEAVTFVHELHILHRDISPDNILLDAECNPVLIDFGAAREKATRASRALSSLLVVKDGYSPQEFYIEGSQQGPSSDLYALGATFYHVLTGAPPPNSHARLAAIAANEPDPYIALAGRSDLFAPEFLSSIDRALNLFPKDRPQSAFEWLHEIDAETRRKSAQLEARNDRNMEASIARLVEETNRAVLEARRLEEERARQAVLAPVEEKSEKKPYFSWQVEDGFFTEEDAREREREAEAPELAVQEPGEETPESEGVGEGEADGSPAAKTPERKEAGVLVPGDHDEPAPRRSSLLSLRPSSVWRLLGVKRDRQDDLGKAQL